MSNKYELELSSGRIVVLRELTSQEFAGLSAAVANDPNPNWELTNRGLRLSLVSDGGTPLEYTKLLGPLLEERFSRPAELLLLRQAWEEVHLPSKEAMARVKAMKVVVD